MTDMADIDLGHMPGLCVGRIPDDEIEVMPDPAEPLRLPNSTSARGAKPKRDRRREYQSSKGRRRQIARVSP